MKRTSIVEVIVVVERGEFSILAPDLPDTRIRVLVADMDHPPSDARAIRKLATVLSRPHRKTRIN